MKQGHADDYSVGWNEKRHYSMTESAYSTGVRLSLEWINVLDLPKTDCSHLYDSVSVWLCLVLQVCNYFIPDHLSHFDK